MKLRNILFALLFVILPLWIIGVYVISHINYSRQYAVVKKGLQTLDIAHSQVAEQKELKDGIQFIVPKKQARVGEVIDVYVVYTPTERANRWKYHISNINFTDKDRHFDENKDINALFPGETDPDKTYTLSTEPRFFHFSYTIPAEVYSQELRQKGNLTYYENIKHPIALGEGKLYMHYSPEEIEYWYDIGYGEGYQGDGFFLSVPFTVLK